MKTRCERLEPKEILVRDVLAVDRTVLATERALIAGTSLVRFFDTPPLIVVSWSLVALSVAIPAISVAHLPKMKRCIDWIGEQCTGTVSPGLQKAYWETN